MAPEQPQTEPVIAQAQTPDYTLRMWEFTQPLSHEVGECVNGRENYNFILIEFNVGKIEIERHPTQIIVRDYKPYENGSQEYTWTRSGSMVFDDVLHINICPEGLQINVTTSVSTGFYNDGRPGGLVERPKVIIVEKYDIAKTCLGNFITEGPTGNELVLEKTYERSTDGKGTMEYTFRLASAGYSSSEMVILYRPKLTTYVVDALEVDFNTKPSYWDAIWAGMYFTVKTNVGNIAVHIPLNWEDNVEYAVIEDIASCQK